MRGGPGGAQPPLAPGGLVKISRYALMLALIQKLGKIDHSCLIEEGKKRFRRNFVMVFFYDLGVQNWIFPKLNISKNTPYYSDLKPDYEIKNNSLQTDIHSLI